MNFSQKPQYVSSFFLFFFFTFRKSRGKRTESDVLDSPGNDKQKKPTFAADQTQHFSSRLATESVSVLE